MGTLDIQLLECLQVKSGGVVSLMLCSPVKFGYPFPTAGGFFGGSMAAGSFQVCCIEWALEGKLCRAFPTHP